MERRQLTTAEIEQAVATARARLGIEFPPCREELRGRPGRCNGGGYDGCACGPYSAADRRKIRDG